MGSYLSFSGKNKTNYVWKESLYGIVQCQNNELDDKKREKGGLVCMWTSYLRNKLSIRSLLKPREHFLLYHLERCDAMTV